MLTLITPVLAWLLSAEPLKHNLLRILTMNLSTLLSTDQTIPFPWKGHLPMDYRVSVDIVQFDRGPDGNIKLKARWVIIDETNKEAPPRSSHRSTDPNPRSGSKTETRPPLKTKVR